MPKNLTDVSTFSSPISVPVGADARTAASVEGPLQQLANRTKYLEDNKIPKIVSSVDNELARFDGTTGKLVQGSEITCDDNGVLSYKTAKARSRIVSVSEVVIGTVLDGTDGPSPQWFTTAGSGLGGRAVSRATFTDCRIFIPLNQILPNGATLTAVRAHVSAGAVRTTGNRVQLQVYKHAVSFVTPGTETSTQVGSTAEDGGTVAFHILSVTGLSEVIDKSQYSYVAVVRGGLTATSDNFLGAKVEWNDPGPRND